MMKQMADLTNLVLTIQQQQVSRIPPLVTPSLPQSERGAPAALPQTPGDLEGQAGLGRSAHGYQDGAMAQHREFTPLGCQDCREQNNHICLLGTPSQGQSIASEGIGRRPVVTAPPQAQNTARIDGWVAASLLAPHGQPTAALGCPSEQPDRAISPAASEQLSLSSQPAGTEREYF